MISRAGPAFSHASPVNVFEQTSAGGEKKAKLGLVRLPLDGERERERERERARESPAISSLCWHLLAFRRDVHLSSSLINNYAVCGPPGRPCILMTARAEAKRREKERRSRRMEWSGRRWSGVEWNGVKGKCKMGSVSCIF